MRDLGNILHQRREELGLSVSEVSKILKIRSVYIEEIEGIDQYTKGNLPSVYLNGYLKSYSKFLGVNPNLIQEQNEQFSVVKKNSKSTRKLKESARPNFLTLLSSVIGIVIVYFLWLNNSQTKPKENYVVESHMIENAKYRKSLQNADSTPEKHEKILQQDLSNKIQNLIDKQGKLD